MFQGLGHILIMLRKPRLKIENLRTEIHNAGTKHEFKNLLFDIKNDGNEEAKGCIIKIKVKKFWDKFEILMTNSSSETQTFNIIPDDKRSIYLCQITKKHPTTTVINTIILGGYPALTKGIYQLEIRFFGKNFVDKKVYQLKLNLSSWENIEIKLGC